MVLITHKRCYANEGAIPLLVRVSDAKVTGSNPVWDILRELTATNKRFFIILYQFSDFLLSYWCGLGKEFASMV